MLQRVALLLLIQRKRPQYLIPCEVPNQKKCSQLDAALSFARFSIPSASSNADCPGYTSNLV